jgi:hypothetical protein
MPSKRAVCKQAFTAVILRGPGGLVQHVPMGDGEEIELVSDLMTANIYDKEAGVVSHVRGYLALIEDQQTFISEKFLEVMK